MDCEFYIGPWQLASAERLKADGFDRLWHPPDGSVGNICLRGSARNDEAAPGLFVMPKGARLSGYEHLGSGDPRSIMPAGRVRIAFESLSGKSATGNSLAEWVRGAIGIHADMSGVGPAPMRPGRGRRLGYWLAGERVLDVPFDLATDEGGKARLRMQEAYRKVRAQARDGRITVKGVADGEFHRRLLSAWGEQYRVNNPEDVFVPADLPRETRLQHGTTLTDDFNRADSATSPGSSSEGWSWVEESEQTGISSNQITWVSGANTAARANSALGSDDHYAQIQRTGVSGTGAGYAVPCIRFASGAVSMYLATWRSSGNAGIYRRVSGSFSVLTSDNTSEDATNTYKLDMAGNDLEAFRNGVSDSTYTDTDATLDGNVYTGVGLRESGDLGDDFEASDGLGGGGTAVPVLYEHRMLSGGLA